MNDFFKDYKDFTTTYDKDNMYTTVTCTPDIEDNTINTENEDINIQKKMLSCYEKVVSNLSEISFFLLIITLCQIAQCAGCSSG